jgi:hypothetical protein
MGKKQHTSASAGNPTIETAEGFLGTSNPERRAEALSMPLDQLIARLSKRLNEQAIVTRRASALVELALEQLPNDTGADNADALLSALQHPLRQLDDGLCEFGGYFEALTVLAKECRHV